MKRNTVLVIAALCCLTMCAQSTDRPQHVPYGGEIMYSGKILMAMDLFSHEGSIELYQYLEKKQEWHEKQKKRINKLKTRIEKIERQKKQPNERLNNKLDLLYDEDFDQPEPEAKLHPNIFMVYPSFFQPYALAVDTYHKMSDKSKSQITYLHLNGFPKADMPIKAQPSVSVTRMEVDAGVADSLLFLLKLANIAATYNDPVNIGLDGTTFYFKHDAKVSRSHDDMAGNLMALINLFINVCNAVKEGNRQRIDDLVPEINRMVSVYRQIVPPDVHIDNIWD